MGFIFYLLSGIIKHLPSLRSLNSIISFFWSKNNDRLKNIVVHPPIGCQRRQRYFFLPFLAYNTVRFSTCSRTWPHSNDDRERTTPMGVAIHYLRNRARHCWLQFEFYNNSFQQAHRTVKFLMLCILYEIRTRSPIMALNGINHFLNMNWINLSLLQVSRSLWRRGDCKWPKLRNEYTSLDWSSLTEFECRNKTKNHCSKKQAIRRCLHSTNKRI